MVAISAPSRCVPQAAQGLAGIIFTLRVDPPTSPRPTLSEGSDIISNSHDANLRL